jgi:hypothetical protein
LHYTGYLSLLHTIHSRTFIVKFLLHTAILALAGFAAAASIEVNADAVHAADELEKRPIIYAAYTCKADDAESPDCPP